VSINSEEVQSRLSRAARLCGIVALALSNTAAIRVGGSPFKTLAEAEEACKAMLGYLTRNLDGE
jgi:hypothetical protein